MVGSKVNLPTLSFLVLEKCRLFAYLSASFDDVVLDLTHNVIHIELDVRFRATISHLFYILIA